MGLGSREAEPTATTRGRTRFFFFDEHVLMSSSASFCVLTDHTYGYTSSFHIEKITSRQKVNGFSNVGRSSLSVCRLFMYRFFQRLNAHWVFRKTPTKPFLLRKRRPFGTAKSQKGPKGKTTTSSKFFPVLRSSASLLCIDYHHTRRFYFWSWGAVGVLFYDVHELTQPS